MAVLEGGVCVLSRALTFSTVGRTGCACHDTEYLCLPDRCAAHFYHLAAAPSASRALRLACPFLWWPAALPGRSLLRSAGPRGIAAPPRSRARAWTGPGQDS